MRIGAIGAIATVDSGVGEAYRGEYDVMSRIQYNSSDLEYQFDLLLVLLIIMAKSNLMEKMINFNCARSYPFI